MVVFEVEMDEVQSCLEAYWFPDGARLVVEVAVTEAYSGRRETAVDKSLVFSNYKYDLSLEKSQPYFKPGLLYRLIVS